MLHWVTSSESMYNFQTLKWIIFPIGGHSLPLNKGFLLTFTGSYGSIWFCVQASLLAVLKFYNVWLLFGVFVCFLLTEN